MVLENVIIECFPAESPNGKMDILAYKGELRDFFSSALERCMEAVGGERGSFFIFDDSRKELVLEVARSPYGCRLRGVRARLGEGVVGRVAKEKRPVLIQDTDEDSSFTNSRNKRCYRSKSFLSVPVEAGGKLIGVINVTDKKMGLPFDGHDFALVINIAHYLGVAVSNILRFLKEQQRINEELKAELDKLKKAMGHSHKFSSLGRLVGGVVHEINNPLDGVIRYVNLAYDCTEEGVLKEYLAEAKSGLLRISRIVRSLLDFSWSLSPESGRIDLNGTIEECLFTHHHLLQSSKIEVRKFLSPRSIELPDYRLKMAFNNIIKNACEVMRDGGVLTVYSEVKDGFVEVRFKDTGPGVPEDIKDKIFEPFFTTKSMGEGSGLGLAITREIISRYQGEIIVENNKGRGSEFIVRIPLK